MKRAALVVASTLVVDARDRDCATLTRVVDVMNDSGSSVFTKFDQFAGQTVTCENPGEVFAQVPLGKGKTPIEPKVFNGMRAAYKLLVTPGSVTEAECPIAPEGKREVASISSGESLQEVKKKLETLVQCSDAPTEARNSVVGEMKSNSVKRTCGTNFAVYVSSVFGKISSSAGGEEQASISPDIFPPDSATEFYSQVATGTPEKTRREQLGITVRDCKYVLEDVFYEISLSSANEILSNIFKLKDLAHRKQAASTILNVLPILGPKAKSIARDRFLANLAVATPDEPEKYAALCDEGTRRFTLPTKHAHLGSPATGERKPSVTVNALGALIRTLERITLCPSAASESAPTTVQTASTETAEATSTIVSKQHLFSENLSELTQALALLGVTGTRIGSQIHAFMAYSEMDSQIDQQLDALNAAEARINEYISKTFEATSSQLTS